MKKIAIIAPSSLANMPFLTYYEKILNEVGAPYDLFYWDRFHDEKRRGKSQCFSCNSPSSGLGSIRGYFEYRCFLLNHLKANEYTFFIVLTMQMGILIKQYLKGKKYLLDIRDYSHENNPVYKILAKRIVKDSVVVAISSDGFRQWLPNDREYILSHNTSLPTSHNGDVSPKFKCDKVIISYIGAVGYYDANILIIKAVARCPQIELRFIGSGTCENELQAYCLKEEISNVKFSGRYLPAQKKVFYEETDFVLACYGKKTLVERTSIPNKLYESCTLGRPIIVNSGTFLAETVKEYGLGIVVDLDEIGDLHSMLLAYADVEVYRQYLLNCELFLEKVKEDIGIFQNVVGRLLNDYAG